jgi:hypothetical protein
MRSLLFALAALTFTANAAVLADVDHMDSRVEWHGVPELKVGDHIPFGDFQLGGFIDVRNDARFNQAALPNHNWRGYALAGFTHNLTLNTHWTLGLPAEFHHESAHASMGIQGATTHAMEMIYDGQYRNVNRNAFATGVNLNWSSTFTANLQIRALEYVRSRNAPEAANTNLAYAQGISAGGELRIPFHKISFELSGFFRHEFQGDRMAYAHIDYDSAGTVISHLQAYPVFHSTNTFSALAGIGIPVGNLGRTATLYTQMIQGNPGGFIDSREQLFQWGGGLMLSL